MHKQGDHVDIIFLEIKERVEYAVENGCCFITNCHLYRYFVLPKTNNQHRLFDFVQLLITNYANL